MSWDNFRDAPCKRAAKTAAFNRALRNGKRWGEVSPLPQEMLEEGIREESPLLRRLREGNDPR